MVRLAQVLAGGAAAVVGLGCVAPMPAHVSWFEVFVKSQTGYDLAEDPRPIGEWIIPEEERAAWEQARAESHWLANTLHEGDPPITPYQRRWLNRVEQRHVATSLLDHGMARRSMLDGWMIEDRPPVMDRDGAPVGGRMAVVARPAEKPAEPAPTPDAAPPPAERAPVVPGATPAEPPKPPEAVKPPAAEESEMDARLRRLREEMAKLDEEMRRKAAEKKPPGGASDF